MKLNVTQKQLAVDEGAYAAARGDKTMYSQIVDDIGGNDIATRAQVVRDISVASAVHINTQLQAGG